MHTYQQDFIDIAQDCGALKYGEFTLKSGRVSPYFFNAGLLNNGQALATLARCYAAVIATAIEAEGLDVDVVFGPAYKGIPLAAITVAALAQEHNINLPYAFNRKEAKTHGEGGSIVGAPLQGKVLVIDDVITAGTAIREAADIIQGNGAELAGVVIAVDRQERGVRDGKLSERSAVQEVSEQFDIPVFSILNLSQLIAHLQQSGEASAVEAMQAYREAYGVTA
ncbi:MAG: orotate phosphoribosyltransferase [Gammaproteobacteria bacterium]|nr:orotate phosphoribosyltransferase [Gammaproteobacteria bacterium]NNC98480.1 orotate phosphoribosyltransferase [Gammaproteobacteria bacterium]NNM12954.1 orotate phosphoribosyltransferase [Gammaproteobacteria bacterium]